MGRDMLPELGKFDHPELFPLVKDDAESLGI
jgi:hypothetical protein